MASCGSCALERSFRDLPERYGPWQACAGPALPLAFDQAIYERAMVVLASIVLWLQS